jgi:hypothetical protein
VILSYNIAIAQKNYFPGWIETKDGQRIEGEILFNDKGATIQEVEFLNLKSGERQRHTPSDLKSFEIEGIKYVSQIVKIDFTPQGMQKEDYLRKTLVVTDTIFLALQIKSSLNLLYYRDNELRNHLFVQADDEEPVELIKHEYKDQVLNPNTNHYETKIITINKFRNQLKYFMRACPSIVDKLERIAFDLNDIQKQIVAYNACIGNAVEYERTNEKIKVQFGVAAGAAMQSLSFESNDRLFEGLDLVDFNPSFNPVVGVSIDVVFPMNFRRWSVNNALLIMPFHYAGNVTIPTTNINSYEKLDFELSGTYVKLLPKLRYTFTNNRVRPFVNAGVSVAYLAGFTNEMKSEYTSYNHVVNSEMSALDKKNYEVGLQVGAGLKIDQKFTVEYVYEGSDGMSRNARLKSTFNRNYLLVTYLF